MSSDPDSEPDEEQIRPTRRSNRSSTIAKLEIRSSSEENSSSSTAATSETESESESDTESERELQSTSSVHNVQKRRRNQRMLDSSSRTSSSAAASQASSDSNVRQRKVKRRPPICDDGTETESSDSSWNPDAASVNTYETLRNDPSQPSTSAAARRNDAIAAAAAAAAASAAAAAPSTSSAAAGAVALPSAGWASSDSSSSASGSDSDSVNGPDKCPICLHSFREQPLGVPDACEHRYCLPCIEEWARNVQTCPIDRLPFTSIARYERGRFVRRIVVEARTTELQMPDDDDEDVTHCEICNAVDREESMLLCDGCNRGYHMDCLQPALMEIPVSSWYCDYCFDSESSASDAEEVALLISEMREIGVPETRLRVRHVTSNANGAATSTGAVGVPRITRTRQSERIRATILSRIAPSHRHAPAGSRETALGMSLPAPAANAPNSSSRHTRTRTTLRTSTTTTTTSSRTRTTAKRRKSGRSVRKTKKRRTSRRTVVIEYDNNAAGQKFPVTTTKKVIKRKRKSAKKRKTTAKRTNRRRAGCSTRSAARQLNRSGENDGAAAAGVTASGDGSATLPSPAVSTLPAVRRSSVVPRLHLFGDPNALEYFSDEHDMSDENAGRGLGGGGDGGLTFAATFARSRIAGPSVLHRQKRVLSALNAGASAGEGADMQATDVLSNILETMDRWHSMTKPDRLKKIRIDADGKLSVPGAEPKKATPTGGVANNSSSSPNGGSSDGGGHSGAGGGRLPEVMNAPRYPRGGGRSGGGGGNGANQQRYQSSGNNGQGGGGGGGGGFRGNDSTGMNGGSGGGSVGSGMSFSIFGPRNSAGAPMMPGGGNGGGVGGDGPDDGPYNNNFNSRNNRRSNINHSAGTAAGGNNSNFSPAHRFQPLHNQQRGFCDANNMFVNSANNGNANRNCGGGGGLYDDPGMPAPMLPITSLPPPPLMIQPPPIAHPPPAFNPSVMLQQQQPHFMPAYRALPPVHIVQHPPPLFETPPPAIVPVVPAVAVEMPVAPDSIPADQYDPTVDSEEPDDGDSALNTSLDIPLPINEAPETAALTKAPKATDDAGTVKISSFGGSDNDESSSSDDCPNFSVYSAESMNVARNLDQGSADRGGEHAEESTDRVAGASTAGTADDGDEMERDEDLVQLDDDDDDNMVAETAEEKLTEDEAGEHEKSLAAAAAKKNVLDLHDDSDWEELNHERSGEGSDIVSAANDERTSKDEDADAQAVKKPEDTDKRHERSYTPCLDEQMPVASEASDDAAPVTGARKNKSDSEDMVDTSSDEDNPSGIAGMQTELISDDDEVEDILNGKSPRNRNKSSRRRSKSRSRPDKKTSEKRRGTDDAQTPRKRSHDRDKEKAKKAERDEAFKKLSRSNRDRNYRDKKEEKRGVDNSSHRRRTRSRSHNKENRTRDHAHKRDSSATRRRDTKRKDMERYDVRNVIAERQPRTHKDQYGRDTSRPRSRSLSRHRRRAAAAPHSRSRSRRRSPATPRADRSRRRVSVHRSRRSRSHSPAPPISANNAATHRSRRASRSPLVARPDGVTPAAAASRSHRPHRSTSSNRLNGKSSRNHSQQQSRHRSPSISHASPTHGACASTSRQRQHQNNAATVASRRSHSRTPGKAQKKAKRSKTRKRKLSPDPTSPARDKHHTSGSHHHAEYPQRQFMEDPHSYHVPPDKKPTYSHDCTRSPSWDRVESSANPTTAPSIPVASTSLNASAGADGKYEAWDAHSDRLSPWTRSPTPVSPEPMSSSWTPPQALQHMHSSAPATASSLHHHSHKKAVLNPTSGVGENLTVILKNKEAASSAKRSSKKSKKRRSEKHGRPDASPTRRERRSKRDKAADHYHHHLSASSKTGSGSTQPSKEVFASGDNILVSVSFNKDKSGASGKPSQQTTIVTLPVSKELIGAKKSSLGADGATTHSSTAGAKSIGASTSRRSKKSTNSDAQPHKHHSHQHQRHKKRTDLKPVAIIDLDRSPFKEITPSPRDIIILDSDTGGSSDDVEICSERRARSRSVGKSTQQSQQPPPSSSNLPPTSSASSTTSSSSSSASSLRMPNAQLSTERRNIAQASQPQSPAGDSEFDVGSGGPKTPPEPIRKSVDSVVCPVVVATATSTTTTALSSLVKFSLPLKNKLRAVNPLHEALDEESSPTQQPAQQPSLVQLQQAQPQSQSQHDLNAPDAITQQTQSSITASSSDADNILPSIQDVSTEVSTSSTAVQDLQQPDADHISAASQEKATTSASSSSSSSARSVSPAVQPKNANHKIGPNTPPESGPCSPDAYNPFEPTESANASPQSHSDSVAKTAPDGRQSQQSRNSVLMTNDNNGGEQQQHCNADDQGHGSHTPELPSHATQELASDDKNTSSGVDKSVKPVDLALALINSKASLDAANSFLSSTLEGGVNMTSSNNAAAGTALSTKTANNNAYDIPNVHCIDDDDDDDDDNGVKDDDIAMHSASKADHNADKYDDVHQSWPTNTQSKANVQPLTVAALKQHLTPLQPSLKTSRFINSISSGSGSLISKLPMPPKSQSNSAGTGGSHSKLSLAGGSRQKQRQNGGSNDDSKVASTAAGHESPYSPDSSDYDDLFEPPPISPGQYGETGGSHSQQHGRPSGGSSRSQHQQSQSHRPSTADVYEDLFGSTSPVQSQHLRQFGNRHPATGAGGNKRSSSPPSHGAGPSNTRSRAKPIALPGRVASTTPVAPLSSHLSDDQQRLFDEIPGSAVEMHAQDQYLIKLNRLDRIVEEVKIVLKPHYTKKYISKDDYKDILRRAVPKINHNRTGEINPKKIKTLVEAYVRKFRHRRKQQHHGMHSSSGGSGGHLNLSTNDC